ncbi:hypothetical protein J4731_25775, partial [Providencia rettgeri]|nr:hypothetical protein [Providencia rettgeri]
MKTKLNKNIYMHYIKEEIKKKEEKEGGPEAIICSAPYLCHKYNEFIPKIVDVCQLCVSLSLSP